MEISQTTPIGLGNSAANGTGGQAMITSDFQTFLSMLTAQIQNQDPLNPMDSTDFATQLATFSGVEQQVRSNELLQGLQDSMALNGMSQMGDWIGRSARAEMPMFFDGQPLSVYAPHNGLADRMELVVTDAGGNVLQRARIPASETAFDWAGVTNDGQPLPSGVYGFHVEYFNEDVPIDTRPAQGYARIEEAQVIDGEIWLTFPGGVQVRGSLVEAVRN